MATLEQVDKAARELEAIVDTLGLAGTIQTLSTICHEKVQHLAENWQETQSDQCKVWKHNAGYLDKVSTHVWRQSWERE